MAHSMRVMHGYHATEPHKADRILGRDGSEREGFNPSANSYDWLGNGAYFFQDAPRFARDWATQHRKEGFIPDPVIVHAEIKAEHILDLTEHGWVEQAIKAYNDLLSEYDGKFAAQRPYTPGAPGGPHPVDALVIERLVNMMEDEVWTVRGAFQEGKPLFPTSHLFTRQHVQIAVRKPEKAIISFEEWTE